MCSIFLDARGLPNIFQKNVTFVFIMHKIILNIIDLLMQWNTVSSRYMAKSYQMPTISVSAELFVLSFCFVDPKIEKPCPKDKTISWI